MKRVWTILSGLLLATCTAACAVASPPKADADRVAAIEGLIAGFRPKFADVPEVEPAALIPRLGAPDAPILVDVRAPAERAVSTLPGAIPAEAIEGNPDAYRGRELVAYCTIGYRSSAWAARMRATGLDVKNLRGSLLLWTHAGGPLVHDGTPTKRLHVYGASWNFARGDHEATW